jgi:hypothetical protein
MLRALPPVCLSVRSVLGDVSQGLLRSRATSAQDTVLDRCLVCRELAGKLHVV